MLYGLALGAGKASILFLYTRLFSNRETFKRLVWATQTFNLLLMAAFTIADGLQCRPTSYYWQRWDKEHKGSCIDIRTYAYAHSGLNIVLDIWMIILPIAQIWKLNMSLRKKLETMAMFAVGILLTITTCVRLMSIRYYYAAPTSVDGWFPVSVWSVVEVNVGVIAACVPSARMLLAKFATEVAQSVGWSKFSESRRDSDETLKNRASFVQRRSEVLASHLKALTSGLARTRATDAVGARQSKEEDSQSGDLVESNEPGCAV